MGEPNQGDVRVGSEENPGLDYWCEKGSNEINAAEFNLQPRLDQYEKFTRSRFDKL